MYILDKGEKGGKESEIPKVNMGYLLENNLNMHWRQILASTGHSG